MENKKLDSDIQALNLQDLKDLLKEIKLYKDLSKKLWIRWRKLYKRWLAWKQELLVEYFPLISEDLAYEKAKIVYEKIFSLNVKKNEIEFVSKQELLWGIKVYLDDSMIDLSFSKVEKFIKG